MLTRLEKNQLTKPNCQNWYVFLKFLSSVTFIVFCDDSVIRWHFFWTNWYITYSLDGSHSGDQRSQCILDNIVNYTYALCSLDGSCSGDQRSQFPMYSWQRCKYRVRQRGCSLTHSARTPPAVHQRNWNWEKIIFWNNFFFGGGVPYPIFFARIF